MKRYGRVVKVKPEKLERYIELHKNPWPEVTAAIQEYNIRNFSIFHMRNLLFSYFEYIGDDFENDMEKLAVATAEWLTETDACQEPIEGAKQGDLWSIMDEVFYQQ